MSVPNLTDECPALTPPPTTDRSVPNLHSDTSAVSLLETFAAVARRRAAGPAGQAGGPSSTNANNSRNTANSLNSGIFGRGLATNSVSSLVRLALSSNFPSGLLNQVSRQCGWPREIPSPAVGKVFMFSETQSL